ncbi:MAG: Ig-like domain-containing protein [Phycisphaerae bacterium]|nr:Ig-like domain-containing protein [Phycisphaerae bacterium]
MSWGDIPKVLVPGQEYKISLQASISTYVKPQGKTDLLFSQGFGLTPAGPTTKNLKGLARGASDYREPIGMVRVGVKGPEKDSQMAVLVVPSGSSSGQNHFGIRASSGNASAFSIVDYLYTWEADTPSPESLLDMVPREELPLPEVENEKEEEEEEEDARVRYAIKAVAAPREVKPDGTSKVEVTATLYKYISGNNQSSQAVAGKTVTFGVIPQYDVVAGTLSTDSAVTDGNGQARVTLTAPTADLLGQARLLINSTAVTARSVEFEAEDTAYITFTAQGGKVWVTPSTGGILSNHGIVPPDRRFPATITAQLQDANLEALIKTEVTFSLLGNDTCGMLRDSNGRTGKRLMVRTDARGEAEIQYFYAASSPPAEALRETIEVRSREMIIPRMAYISTGLHLVLDDAESAYEGQGEINTGENVPLRIGIKDLWHPELDLSEIIGYWGLGGSTGDTRLYVKLEIENLGTVPVYLLDVLRMTKQTEPPFVEKLDVRSSEKGMRNVLWVPRSSLKTYGYPQIRPMFQGNNNYELRISLVDATGKPVFDVRHPRKTAFLGVPTGMPAEAFSIFFLSNPLGEHTPEARLARKILSAASIKIGNNKYAGFGAILSLVDAAFAINRGDTEGLIGLMLSDVKGQILGDIADGSGSAAPWFSTYNDLSLVEQFASLAVTTYADAGPIARIEGRVLSEVASRITAAGSKLVVLHGDGRQVLRAKSDQGEGDIVPTQNNKIVHDRKRSIIAIQNGPVSVFLLPGDMEFTVENASGTLVY